MTEQAQAPQAAGSRSQLADELKGLDILELPLSPHRARLANIWSSFWPKLAAIGIVLLIWQAVVWLRLWPDYVLPGPGVVLAKLAADLTGPQLPLAIAITLRRAFLGFALALLIGTFLGLAIVRWKTLRTAVASLITGLQTMPSIAWFPLAILLFGLNETAIMFVVDPGRRAVDRQRPDRRRRPHPAHHPARRPRARRQGFQQLPLRDPACVAAVIRGWHEAGLGICLAQPDGGRVAGHHRGAAVDWCPARALRATSRTRRRCWRR